MLTYLSIIVTAIFVNNIVFAQFLGICPFLGVSKKLSSAVGMGAAVMFVMTLATCVTWLVQHGILEPWGLGYMQTIVFILVIAALVQMLEIIIKKIAPGLYQAHGCISSAHHHQLCRTWRGHYGNTERDESRRIHCICCGYSHRLHPRTGCIRRHTRTPAPCRRPGPHARDTHRTHMCRHACHGLHGIFRHHHRIRAFFPSKYTNCAVTPKKYRDTPRSSIIFSPHSSTLICTHTDRIKEVW